MRIVGRRASLGQRSEQNEAGDAIGTLRGKFDACRSALRRAKQNGPAASGSIEHRADVMCRRIDAGIESDPIGEPDATTIKQDETPHLCKGGQECPAPGFFPNPFDMGNKTGQQQNINVAGAVGLESEMDAAAPDIARRRRVLEWW